MILPGNFPAIFFIFLSALPIHGQTFHELNDKAIAAYDSGQYQEAIDVWNQLYHAGNSDPDLLYNLGNAQSMSGNIPLAILFYEKALRFKPGDKDIRAAIENERNKIENPVSDIQMFFLTDWFRIMLSFLRPGGWAMLSVLFFLLALYRWLASMKLIKFNKFHLRGKMWLYILTGYFFLLLGFLSYRQIYFLNEGIVFSTCDMRQGPANQSPLVRVLHPGEKVRFTDGITNWHKVKLLNLDEGWVEKDCIRIIDVRERK